MKKSYVGLISLTLVVLLGYSLYPSHENRTKTHQIEDMGEMNVEIPDSENILVFNPVREENATNIQHELTPALAINEDIYAKAESDIYINSDAKSLNAAAIQQKINISNFQTFLDEISIEQSELDIEMDYKVAGILNEQTNLNSYYYSSGCGKGVCGVEVKYIPNDEASKISESLSQLLNFGAIITGVHNDNDDSSSVRLVFASDKNVNGMTFPSDGSIGIKN